MQEILIFLICLRMVDFTCPNIWEDETEKDIWELEKLPIEIKNNPIKKVKTLNFISNIH